VFHAVDLQGALGAAGGGEHEQADGGGQNETRKGHRRYTARLNRLLWRRLRRRGDA
jgi:hypothetical protein